MRNYHKIVVLLLVSLTMVISLDTCMVPVSDAQQDGKSDIPTLDSKKTTQTGTQPQSEPNTYNDSLEPQYFFINGSLLGSYDDDGWHSLCDTGNHETGAGDSKTFYVKDLLNQDSYYVYDGKKLLGMSKQIIWSTEETSGLGSFEDEDIPEKFAKYGKLYYFEGNGLPFSCEFIHDY